MLKIMRIFAQIYSENEIQIAHIVHLDGSFFLCFFPAKECFLGGHISL